MAKEKEQGFIATVKLGPKGQIVIPKEVRDMFGVGPGDSLVLMAHPKRGIALQKQSFILKAAQSFLGGNHRAFAQEESQEDMETFASIIQNQYEEDTE